MRLLRPRGPHQLIDTQDLYDTLQVVGPHMKTHYRAHIFEALGRKVLPPSKPSACQRDAPPFDALNASFPGSNPSVIARLQTHLSVPTALYASAFLLCIFPLGSNHETQGKSTQDKKLAELDTSVRLINNGLPKMLNPENRLERATSGPGLMMTYQHTFLTEISPHAARRQFEINAQASVQSFICGMMADTLNSGVIFHYTTDGDSLAYIRIVRDGCR